MTTTSPTASLAAELTRIALATPGVTAIYPPVRAVPVLGVAERMFTDLAGSSPIGRVLVDDTTGTVTASVGVDVSAPAGDIIRGLCSRFEGHLHQSSETPMSIKITIAYSHN